MRFFSIILFLKIGLLALELTPISSNDLLEKKIEEIQMSKNLWIPFASEEKKKDPEFFNRLHSTLEKGSVEQILEGEGGTYLLKDPSGIPSFIIKPIDESINCLNNPKHPSFFFPEILPRRYIPLYQSAQREAFCYELATLCGMKEITPKTHLSVFSLPRFFLFSSKGSIEKVCSVAEYIPNSRSLRSLLQTLFSSHLKDEDLEPYFSQEDFALINLFIWLIYDTDAHAGNILVYPKKIDDQGFITYGLKKIDNSLSFPEKNADFFHFLMHFPFAKADLSPLVKEKISNLPLKDLEKSLERFRLHSTLFAFRQRVYLLQELMKRPSISYYEVSLRLLLLEKEEGLELALSTISLEDLEKLLPGFL